MGSAWPKSSAALWAGTALLLGACHDASQSPPDRPEPSPESQLPEASASGPADLVYVCGNRFLATNSSELPVQVTYRVVGTGETGSLTLPEGVEEEPGFTETELETKARGLVELYRDDELVVRRRNPGTPCGPAAISFPGASLASVEGGTWTAPFPWRDVAVHLSLLPTGKVLSWGEFQPPQLWDPANGSFTAIPSPINLFCSGHSFLSDGRLLVAGGHIGRDRGYPDITIFDPVTESWSQSAPMARGRWYPTNTTLGNGDVLIIAGRDEIGERVLEPEVWTPSGHRSLSNASRTLPYYPRIFLAPDGRLFYAGEQISSKFLNPSGTGGWTRGPSQLYPTSRNYGASVMYDEGKVLYVGGGSTTNTAEIIDLNSAAPAWQWTGSMAFPRRHLNATVLPTGEVLVTSGSSGTKFNDYLAAVHAAELWSPVTGTWRTLSSNTVNRAYHSTSLLLPDGRVLHAGSGQGGGGPSEENAEIFSPPYLFQGERPVITQAPSVVGYGTSFRVSTPQAGSIEKVSLIRLGSTTHAFDMNQRFQWLPFVQEEGVLAVAAPTSRNLTPPGHYMLFILDDGVPSEARIVRVASASEAEAAPPVASFTWSCLGFTCSFSDRSTDESRVTDWSWDFGDGAGTSAEQNPGYTYGSAGTYEVSLTVTDDSDMTETATRTITVSEPAANSPPTAAFSSSCTYLDCAFTDGSTDADGQVTEWSWDFGDGTVSSARNPSHAYAAAGSYSVTLTVSDDMGATHESSSAVTVSEHPPISLSATGRTQDGRQYMTLTWTGANGASVDIHRNGKLLKTTANDGRDTNSRSDTGPATYTFRLCEAGSTICSNEATVEFGGSSIVLSATGRFDGERQYMTLTWTGASGTTVDIYRNGSFLKNTANDGRDTNSRKFQGAAKYVFKLCQAGTTICSNEAVVEFS